ncbi:hypothetical protein ACFV5C_32245, partial [Streptomyces sp. NPDC059762]
KRPHPPNNRRAPRPPGRAGARGPRRPTPPRAGRRVLWTAADPAQVATILRIVNPDLLPELPGA